jgi:hypothetical protein
MNKLPHKGWGGNRQKNDKNENLKEVYLTLLQYFRQIGE